VELRDAFSTVNSVIANLAMTREQHQLLAESLRVIKEKLPEMEEQQDEE
jgi:hypothetical protein